MNRYRVSFSTGGNRIRQYDVDATTARIAISKALDNFVRYSTERVDVTAEKIVRDVDRRWDEPHIRETAS